jgi:hypothetical protein
MTMFLRYFLILSTTFSLSGRFRCGAAVLLSLAVSLSSVQAQSQALSQEDSYCLSGGNRTAYTCEQLTPTGQLVKEMFAIQVVADEQVSLQALDYTLLHEMAVGDDKRLVYFGGFEDLERGQQALAEFSQRLGADYRPLLVAFTPREPMPLIRLVAEPDTDYLQLASVNHLVSETLSDVGTTLSDTITDSANAREEQRLMPERAAEKLADQESSDNLYDLVYSIQIGAYKYANYGQNFAKQHSQIPLQCRQKDNGIFAVYYGLFENFKDAKGHLTDYPLLAEVGAYVVKLKDVTFSPCGALAERIEQSRKAAYGEARCGGAQGCDVNAEMEKFLPKLPDAILPASK